MENDQKQKVTDDQSFQAGKNPTLDEKGTSVPDYGNVMGGSADENGQDEKGETRKENDRRAGEGSDTLGNP